MEGKQIDYRFYAFISYSRKNEKEAKWLQKKLEAYRLPTVLQKQHSELPKSLKIFRDKTDIGVGGTVASALSRELQDSKKLIVLCSPDSAKSEYVEYEIESFIKLGRSSDDILPFVVAGEIKRGSAADCYGAKLHELNLNAADSVQEGKGNAFVRLLASLLGIKYDDLKKRERARMIRNNCLLGTACAAIVAFSSAVAWYVTPHTRYYADYVTRWGIPEGIGKPLSEKEIKGLFEHYEITSQYNRPVKLLHANSAGTPIAELSLLERQNRPVIAVYKYKDSFLPVKRKDLRLDHAIYTICPHDVSSLNRDYVIRAEYKNTTNESADVVFYYDTTDNPLQKQLSNDVLADGSLYYFDVPALSASNDVSDIVDFSPELVFMENNSAIYVHKITYDKESGFEKRLDFYNKNNRVVADKNGVTGILFEYDLDGRCVFEEYLYEEYKYGIITKKKLVYDDENRLVSVSFFGIGNEALFNDTRCFSKKKITWNENGNYSTIAFFDENGECAPQKNYYDAIVINNEYDERGFEKKTKLVMNDNSVVLLSSTSDEKGLPVEMIISFPDGRFAYRINSFDSDGKILDAKLYDVEGNELDHSVYEREKNKVTIFVVQGDDKYKIIDDYDAYGRHIQETQQINGETYQCKIAYSGDNRSICYLKNGQYYIPEQKGYARAEFAYNNDGKLVYAGFKDEKGAPVVCNLYGFDFATYRATYSPNCHLIYEAYNGNDFGRVVSGRYGHSWFWGETDINDVFLRGGIYGDDREMRSILYRNAEDGTRVLYFSSGSIRKEKLYGDDGSLKETYLYSYDADGICTVFKLDSLGDAIGRLKIAD